MRRTIIRTVLVAVALLACLPALPAAAQVAPVGECPPGWTRVAIDGLPSPRREVGTTADQNGDNLACTKMVGDPNLFQGDVFIDNNVKRGVVVSDRAAKADFSTVDGREVLARLAGVPIETWSYRDDGPAVRHIGPMAQDFHAAFGVGESDRTIDLVDGNGVALAAIQGLHRLVQEQDAQLAAERERSAALEARLAAVEQRVAMDGAASTPLQASLPLAWPLLGGLVLVGLAARRRRA